MDHMSTGYTAQHDDMIRSLAYVSFQELATRVSHRNTGKIAGDAVADQLLARVAADENLHMVFYRNLLGAALELDPSQTMRAITDVVTTLRDARHRHRRLPAQGRRDGDRRRLRHPPAPRRRGRAGAAVLERLRDRGPRRRGRGRPRTELADFMAELEKQALRFEDKRDALKARMAAREAR